ncbi:hypothetical protein [Oceanirhabdus sp. W0125-5]|uniref:hypothetical protein n=1 Tax=Oceanirhabdus sp. W0125-5 TaxID=2999116 RepID=UPI0022F2B21A|nr:hypothetical protein [Oceanirhabdus sp. W0125-5]WBW98606.1 hypothetical protein OW730_07575 [Oceanirhabdus sp. W0125-5]
MSKVFAAYFILIIILTSFMIKPIVKNKSIFTRFVIYMIVGNFYVMNIVFILSYLNIFNRAVLIIALLFTTVFIRIILDKEDAKRIYIDSKETIKHLLNGEYGVKLFFYRKFLNIRLSIKSFCNEVFKGNKLEWIILLAIIGYNIYYFYYNSINFVSFGAPDEEVHLYWIQSLIGGKIFPDGVYPHGFHNIVSAITVVFGFKAVTVMNSFGVVSMVLIMTMLYFGLRKILEAKYAALFGIMVYSTVNIYDIESIYRFQFSIPQEYGMIMLMPMAIFLFRYLEDKKISDLVFFGMCLSMTVSIHFYLTIIALVLCLSIGIVYLYRIIKKRLLMKLILCGILSAVVAIAPLAVGLAMGNEMEQSMNWAVRVIQGKEYSSNDESNEQKNEIKNEIKNDEKDQNMEEIKPLSKWESFLVDAKHDINKFVFLDFRVLYIFLSLIALTILYSMRFAIFKNKKEENLYQLTFAIYGLFLIFLMLCRALKIPTLMEPKRVAIFFAYLSPFFIAMPFEVLSGTFGKGENGKKCSIITLISIPVCIFIIVNLGFLRPLPPFYYFQTKGAMINDLDIMEKFNDHEWTIVSPVNDISVIQNNGYHYELSDFILKQENWNEDIEIRVPTKYVFIYIEKRPLILYGWRFNKDDKGIINRDMVTYEDAQETLERGMENNEYYKEHRKILMSKAYYWAEEYKKYFPKEMSVYYEDDEIIVYKIVQNEYALNNFSINYGANEKRDDK